MSDNVLAMHRVFLSEVRAKKEELKRQLEQLTPVETYHESMVESLSRNGSSTEKASGIVDGRLLHASRHDACEIALRELGGKARTSEIANWLLVRGYGSELRSRVFQFRFRAWSIT